MGLFTKKRLFIIAALVLGICVIFLAISYASQDIAVLYIESGVVEVDVGTGWKTADDGMKLREQDIVKTGEGRATIVLHESIIVQIEPDSEIQIVDLDDSKTEISETVGSVWIKFTGVTGIDTLTIGTPKTVATVRRTELWMSIDEVRVVEGEVEVVYNGQKELVAPGEKAFVTKKNLLDRRELTEAEWDQMREGIERNTKIMKKQRLRVLEKDRIVYSIATNAFGLDRSTAERYLDELDNNDEDLENLTSQLPYKPDSVKKAQAWTEEIRNNVRLLESIK